MSLEKLVFAFGLSNKMLFSATFFSIFLQVFTLVSAESFVCERAADSESYKNTNELLAYLEEQVELLKTFARKRDYDDVPEVMRIETLVTPKDCQELLERGYTTNGIYEVSPDGRCPFRVYCDMDSGGWTVIQRHQDGNVNFRRNWTEYVQGFGDLEGDHWLGLEKIHRLSKEGSQIHFTLQSYDFNNEYAQYDGFIVHDVMSSYKMNVDPYGYEGTIPDLFTYHDGFKFSTYDRDNDEHSSNCCDVYGGGGGWWYNSCYRLGVLNGIYGKLGRGGISLWNREDKYFKSTIIKIRPRKGMC